MPLPDFVIAGERRCGTTTLADRLSTHPEIFVHGKRDGGFFIDAHIRKGGSPSDWAQTHSIVDYEDFFAQSGAASKSVIGEKSADYLYFRPAHERMARFLPKAKFIFILRNPIARAWSHYWNEVGKGRERLSFPEALQAEKSRVTANGYDGYHLSYVSRGFYDDSLSHFFNFVPRDRCHIVVLESLLTAPRSELDRVAAFLGVSKFEDIPEGVHSNSNWTMVHRPWAMQQPLRGVADAYMGAVRLISKLTKANRERRRSLQRRFGRPFFQESSRMTMNPSTRNELAGIFEPHTRKLEHMLGVSLASWHQLKK